MLPSPLKLSSWFAALAAVVLALFALKPERSSGQALRTPYYGINFINMEEAALIAAIHSGAGSARWEFGWRSHEVEPGEWDWRAADWLIGPLAGSGFETLAMLHDPPAFWEDERGVPINLDLPWDHPGNGWGQFCFRFAERYGDEVPGYEIWNEPDVKEFWSGTAEEYYLLLKTCSQAIRAADPAATIVMGSMLYLHDPSFYEDVLAFAAADPDGASNGYFFDVVGLHVYTPPYLIPEIVGDMQTAMNRAGLPDHPIWITEFGILNEGYGITPNGPGYGRATEERAAWYLLQSIAEAQAAGVERMIWYRWADDKDIVSYGLTRDDLTFRRQYVAFQHAAGTMHSVIEAERTVLNRDLVQVEMQRADGARVIAAYTLSGEAADVRIPAVGAQAVLFDPVGDPQVIIPDADGFYTFSLPADETRDLTHPDDYSMGGPLYTLVE